MNIKNYIIGKLIGVINQIEDDRHLHFIANNEIKCNIGDIVGILNNDKSIVIAVLSDIELEYYLENAKLFFISKAVENNIQQLSDPKHKPRYGQFITAVILGHYEFKSNGYLTEIKNTVNRFTPLIFQEVFLISIEKSMEIFGLSMPNICIDDPMLSKTVCLGQLTFPTVNSSKNNIFLHYKVDVFKRHTLITGVTGSGKSRLAALLVKELANFGAHITIIDPHNEYTDLLASTDNSKIYVFRQLVNGNNEDYGEKVKFRTISFSEKDLNAHALCRLLPHLSNPQENKIYEIFNKLGSIDFNTLIFLNKLMDELNIELKAKYFKDIDKIEIINNESKKVSKNHTDFIERYIKGIKPITDFGKADLTNVLTAVISKINELRKDHIIDNISSNWLLDSPHSIDIINIDYSSNEYVRRFLNGIFHFFLRKKSNDELRILVVDEAHMLLKEESMTSQLVIQLLREARKFNLTIIFISQNKEDIPSEIRSQFQNQFQFRESEVGSTKYFPDRICQVSLFGSKTSFSMNVNEILGLKH